jgi:hypothetical protein
VSTGTKCPVTDRRRGCQRYNLEKIQKYDRLQKANLCMLGLNME